jgi:acyl carrier protein
MTNDDGSALLARLLHHIAPEAEIAGIDPDAPLQEALDLDSMDYLNLLTALSQETGIDVPEQDYPKLSTANGFAAYVASASRG